MSALLVRLLLVFRLLFSRGAPLPLRWRSGCWRGCRAHKVVNRAIKMRANDFTARFPMRSS
jgi:hypothetical protein